LAAVWALVAGLMAFIPNFGGVIALLGPVFSILLSGHDMDRLLFLLGLYAVIVVIDQLFLQPVIMKRVTRVPIWASLLTPIVLGILIPFWGVLLAAARGDLRLPPAAAAAGRGRAVISQAWVLYSTVAARVKGRFFCDSTA
jgi:hypothetical protein